jgi:serine protease inhibitor
MNEARADEREKCYKNDEQINNWIEQKSNEKIKAIFEELDKLDTKDRAWPNISNMLLIGKEEYQALKAKYLKPKK